jgi:hypothetical protein
MSEISRIVTDQKPQPEWLEYLQAHAIALHYPENAPPTADPSEASDTS